LLGSIIGHPRTLWQTSGKAILSWDARICSGFVYSFSLAYSSDSARLTNFVKINACQDFEAVRLQPCDDFDER
jgi:hypothetical protein